MKIRLLRHGRTYGNTKNRYIGVTDEPLLAEEEKRLVERKEDKPELLFVSPRLRCRKTAELFFPERKQIIIPDLAECDFGIFENKNWKELSDCEAYQIWIDSNGTLPFPEGEDPEEFRIRCQKGFQQAISMCIEKKVKEAAFVVHGGTIMSILEKYGIPKKDFYQWHVKNGEGYEGTLDLFSWERGKREINNVIPIGEIGGRI